VKVLHPTQHKTGHFGDVLPSQSLGLVLIPVQESNLDRTHISSVTKTH